MSWRWPHSASVLPSGDHSTDSNLPSYEASFSSLPPANGTPHSVAPSWTTTRSPDGEISSSAIPLVVWPSGRGGEALPVSAATVVGPVTTAWCDQSADATAVRTAVRSPRSCDGPPATGTASRTALSRWTSTRVPSADRRSEATPRPVLGRSVRGAPPAIGHTITSPSVPPVITSRPSAVSWSTSGAEGAVPSTRAVPVRRSYARTRASRAAITRVWPSGVNTPSNTHSPGRNTWRATPSAIASSTTSTTWPRSSSSIA